MLEDVAIYFDESEEDEYQTSQQCIGIGEIFRGFIVKDWEGADFHCEKYSELNKILVANAVRFYNECWKDRNEWYFNERKQKERVVKWYHEIKREVEEKGPMQVKVFVRRSQLDVQRCSTETIKKWIRNASELCKRIERLPKSDIRRYMES